MMPEEKLSLADQIRGKLDAGVLPHVRPENLPEKMWTGYGCGNPCHGCSQPIYPAQIEYHFPLDSGDVVRLHIGCLGMWLAELRRRGFDHAAVTQVDAVERRVGGVGLMQPRKVLVDEVR